MAVSWQDTELELLNKMIPRIVETLQSSRDSLQRLMTAVDELVDKRKIEWEAENET